MSFLQGRVQGLRSLHALVAAIALLVTYYGLLLLHPSVHFAPHAYWHYVVIYPSLILLGHFLFSLNHSGNGKAYHHLLRRFSHSWGLWFAAQDIAVIALTLLVGIVLTKDTVIARTFLVTLFPILWLALVLSLYILQNLGLPRLFEGRHRLQALLVANVSSHDPLVDWLEAYNCLGLELRWIHSPQGLPDAYRHLDPGLAGVPAEEVVAKLQPSVVVCSDADLHTEQLARVRKACDACGSRFTVHLGHISGLGNAAGIYSDLGHAFAVFRHEPLESPFGRMLKRTFDLAISIPVAVFILPILIAIVSIIHRRQSPGPLFYTQERGGAGHHTFRVFKFRTMHCNHGRDGDQAVPQDARIFPAGEWMRKFSLDEFPQFLNVLRGDMSVVGPRPHYVDHDAQFADLDPLYRLRKLLKPGVTGLSQVAGFRGVTRTRADVRVRSYTDIAYLENWSLGLDCLIVIKTLWHLLHPPKSAL